MAPSTRASGVTPAKARSKVAREIPCAAASFHRPARKASNVSPDWPLADPTASKSVTIGNTRRSSFVDVARMNRM